MEKSNMVKSIKTDIKQVGEAGIKDGQCASVAVR